MMSTHLFAPKWLNLSPSKAETGNSTNVKSTTDGHEGAVPSSYQRLSNARHGGTSNAFNKQWPTPQNVSKTQAPQWGAAGNAQGGLIGQIGRRKGNEDATSREAAKKKDTMATVLKTSKDSSASDAGVGKSRTTLVALNQKVKRNSKLVVPQSSSSSDHSASTAAANADGAGATTDTAASGASGLAQGTADDGSATNDGDGEDSSVANTRYGSVGGAPLTAWKDESTKVIVETEHEPDVDDLMSSGPSPAVVRDMRMQSRGRMFQQAPLPHQVSISQVRHRVDSHDLGQQGGVAMEGGYRSTASGPSNTGASVFNAGNKARVGGDRAGTESSYGRSRTAGAPTSHTRVGGNVQPYGERRVDTRAAPVRKPQRADDGLTYNERLARNGRHNQGSGAVPNEEWSGGSSRSMFPRSALKGTDHTSSKSTAPQTTDRLRSAPSSPVTDMRQDKRGFHDAVHKSSELITTDRLRSRYGENGCGQNGVEDTEIGQVAPLLMEQSIDSGDSVGRNVPLQHPPGQSRFSGQRVTGTSVFGGHVEDHANRDQREAKHHESLIQQQQQQQQHHHHQQQQRHVSSAGQWHQPPASQASNSHFPASAAAAGWNASSNSSPAEDGRGREEAVGQRKYEDAGGAMGAQWGRQLPPQTVVDVKAVWGSASGAVPTSLKGPNQSQYVLPPQNHSPWPGQEHVMSQYQRSIPVGTGTAPPPQQMQQQAKYASRPPLLGGPSFGGDQGRDGHQPQQPPTMGGGFRSIPMSMPGFAGAQRNWEDFSMQEMSKSLEDEEKFLKHLGWTGEDADDDDDVSITKEEMEAYHFGNNQVGGFVGARASGQDVHAHQQLQLQQQRHQQQQQQQQQQRQQQQQQMHRQAAPPHNNEMPPYQQQQFHQRMPPMQHQQYQPPHHFPPQQHFQRQPIIMQGMTAQQQMPAQQQMRVGEHPPMHQNGNGEMQRAMRAPGPPLSDSGSE